MSIENDVYQHGQELGQIESLYGAVLEHINGLRKQLFDAADIYTDDGLEYCVVSSVDDLDIDGCSEYMQFDNAIEAVESRHNVIDRWLLTNHNYLTEHFVKLINGESCEF